MNTKPLLSKAAALLIGSLFTLGSAAQAPQTISTDARQRTDTLAAALSRAEKRLERYRKLHNAFIPQSYKAQFLGGMGFISLGPSWSYGKKKQWETDFLLGFIPKYNSDAVKVTLTLKQNYIPWNLPLKYGLSLEPLTCGLYLNTVFSNKFWTHEPDRYPSGYYGFSTRIRANIFLGQRIMYRIPDTKREFARAIGFFYELSTCDFYLVSAVTNRSLRPRDYLRLSFGLKLQIF